MLCRREGIAESLYYNWSKEFLEAGKSRLAGDTVRQATAAEVKELRSEALALKEVVTELTLENRLVKKSMVGDGHSISLRSLSHGYCFEKCPSLYKLGHKVGLSYGGSGLSVGLINQKPIQPPRAGSWPCTSIFCEDGLGKVHQLQAKR